MSVTSKKTLLKKLLSRKGYRDAYVAEHVKTSVPIQIRTLREQRELTQTQLAREAHTTQTVVSRLEDPNYGNLSINSLLKLASALDLALLVKFVPFSRLLREFGDASPAALAASSISDETEIQALQEWAREDQPGTSSNVFASAGMINFAMPRSDYQFAWPGQFLVPISVENTGPNTFLATYHAQGHSIELSDDVGISTAVIAQTQKEAGTADNLVYLEAFKATRVKDVSSGQVMPSDATGTSG